MFKVNFYESADDQFFKVAVIAARFEGKWIFCRHKDRETYEIAGGHREEGEAILNTAKRELFEETGAIEFDIEPVCVYAGDRDGVERYGMFYFAEVKKLGKLPDMEIAEIKLFDDIPENLTYPAIQKPLFEKLKEYLKQKDQK